MDTELFAIEQWTFRLIGFGAVIDLPHKDISELPHMRDIVQSGSGPITPELITQLRPDMAEESAAAVDSVRQETSALVSTVGQFRLRA